MTAGVITAEEATQSQWDVIVIGAGMGGGLVGRRLAEGGLSVLFLEKGPVGRKAEEQELRADLEDPSARQLRGYWPTPVEANIDGQKKSFFAPLGSGVGGSSVFYAAALERPEKHDLESKPGLPHPTGGWPLDYEAYRPYFDQAASILSIRGGTDPLSEDIDALLEPIPLNEAETTLFEDVRKTGLHPYRAHEALRRVPGCVNCIGHKCPRDCKMDGRSAGVLPALATGYAKLLPNCSVERLNHANRRVTEIFARTLNGEIRLTAETVVLAAGALHSPRLLLASECANSSGWVGRGLMFHLNELFALWPRRGQVAAGATRAVAFRDFYSYQGHRLGLVQSMGVRAEFGHIAAYLKNVLAGSRVLRLPGVEKLTLIVAAFAARIFGNATVFVGIMEDLPYFENRVTSHPDDQDVPVIKYAISKELKKRRKIFRRQLRKALGWHRTIMLGFSPALNFGHPSGTLRFGSDPKDSVLDADCKAHDLENLYVADASFMPTSMGVNPSMMIAANALRVGDTIIKRARRTERKVG